MTSALRPDCPHGHGTLRNHDTRRGVVRWECLVCGELFSGLDERLVPAGLSTKTGNQIAEGVTRGMDVQQIAAHYKISVPAIPIHLAAMEEEAWHRYFEQHRRPGDGTGWWPVSMGVFEVAVGRQRQGFRVVDWVKPGDAPLADVIGRPPVSSDKAKGNGAGWLASLMGPDPAKHEQRLWVGLARTNTWPLI